MTMKTSCISPPQWSKRDQHVSTPAATKPFAGEVSSETACAICFRCTQNGCRSQGSPAWCGSVRKQRLEVTGEYIHNKEIISTVISLTVMIEGKPRHQSPSVAARDVGDRFVGRRHRVLAH